jgi:lysozyme
MTPSKDCIDLIKKFEGCKLSAYLCPANVPTIGYGNTFYKGGVKVKLGDKITQQEAELLLLDLLPRYVATVENNIKVPLLQNEFDALICFCWNCGSSETLFKMINNKENKQVIYNWWTTHYITGGGGVLKGLITRRKAEADLFVKV